MHEAAIVASILECAERVAREHGGLPISRIVLEVGALQHVVPEALKFAFDAAVRDTRHAGAELSWREIPARVRCAACGAEYVPDDVFWVCPECDQVGGAAVQGDELVLCSVELDESARGMTGNEN